MTDFSISEFKTLVSHESGECVSLYMPIERENGQTRQAHIRLNNMLRDAETQLVGMNMSHADAKALLEPARALLDSNDFWSQSREGLALFIAKDFFRQFDDTSIAIKFTEMLFVADHFQIKPLLPLLAGNGQFYILALEQNHMGLLQATRDTIHPVNIVGAPDNMHDALGEPSSADTVEEHEEKVDNQHEKFGAYDPDQKEKDRILRYFRVVNGVVHKYLADQQAPLVLAGMDYQHSIYRQANTYPHLLDEGVTHNVLHINEKELHELAWKIVEPIFEKTRQRDIERFQQDVHLGRTLHKLIDILEAAHFGRVDTLFIAENHQQFGTFDPATLHLEAFTAERPGSVDLIDQAAVQTIINGGKVYVLPANELPNPLDMVAALLRY